ncbi:MAG: hypothetical protein L3J33_00190 [Rhodobacteraceae bacterium]|nr:hypothetical protein [Paracoccaceae bacterium]
MKGNPSFTSLIFVGLLAVAVGLAGFGFLSFKKDLDALNKSNQENISWSAMQLDQELLRFKEAILAYKFGEDQSERQLNKRFDILWSRVAIFQRGRVGERLRSYDSEANIIGRLFEEIQRQAPTVENIGSASVTEIDDLHDVLDLYSIEMRGLSQAIFAGEEKLRSDLNAQMRRSANTTLGLSIASVIFLLIGLGMSSWQGRRYKNLAHKNKALAEIAENASQSKTRFLTMMSHELRTPMNGVLGLLALLRQSKTTEPQENIIEQAERSARQMIGMLTDILDFAALQNNDIELEAKSFEVAQLVETLNDLFAPEARRAGINFDVVYAKGGPLRISGDFRRLKQVYTQLASYFMDLAGVKSISMVFNVENSELKAEIALDYASTGAAWNPDLVLGGRADNDDNFAADALGPAVARGLIAKMEGKINLLPPRGNQVVIAVSVPILLLELSTVNVQLEMSSHVMASICKTALRDAPVSFQAPEYANEVHVILFETGGLDEAGKVSDLHKIYSKALIIAIGHPINPDIFDSVIQIPTQISERIGPVIDALAS